MASRRLQIVQAAEAALNGPGKPVGVTVHRNRHRPIDADALPAMVVYSAVPAGAGQSERVERLDHEPGVERVLNLRVECRATGEPTDEAVDPLYLWAVRALLEEDAFGGLVKDIEERAVSEDAADKGKPIGAVAVDFEVTYETDEFDPEVG